MSSQKQIESGYVSFNNHFTNTILKYYLFLRFVSNGQCPLTYWPMPENNMLNNICCGCVFLRLFTTVNTRTISTFMYLLA